MTIETKYNNGDTVYTMKDDKVYSPVVSEIHIKVSENNMYMVPTKQISYLLTDSTTVNESRLYKSKPELLDSL